MKVVYVSTIERGGPLTHLRQLVPRVAAAGVAVPVVCGNEPVAETFRALGVPVEVVPIAAQARRARRRRRSWPLVDGADVVHTHDRRAGLFGRLAGRLRGSRVLHTLHGMPEEIAARIGRPDAPDPPGVSAARIAWLVQGYLRIEAALTRLGHVVAPSQAMADFMLAHGFPARLVHVIPYGIELAEPVDRPATGDVLVAGVAANLEYWKGIDVLIEAARLAEAPLRLEIYGVGSLRDELERQARAAGVDARFHGFVADMRDPFAAARRARPALARRQPAARDPRGDGRRPAGRRHARRRDPRAGRRRRDGLRRRAGESGGARRRPSIRSPPTAPGAASSAQAAPCSRRGALLGRRDRPPHGRALRGAVRILHVIQELGTGGAERVLLSAYRGARGAGHEVVRRGRARDRWPTSSTLRPSRCRSSSRRPWRVPAAALAVRRAVRETRPDVVHAHNPTMAVLAGLATRRGQPPAGARQRPRRRRRRTGRRRCGSSALSGLPPVACGPGVAAALRASTGSRRSRPFRTRLALRRPPPTARSSGPDRHAARASRSAGSSSRRTTRSRSRRSPQVPDATLAIVGDGPLRSKLEQPRCRARRADRVVFLGVRRTRER